MMQLNLHSRKITHNSVNSVFERRKTVRPRSRPDREKGRYVEARVGAEAAHFTFLSSAWLPVLIRVSIIKHCDQKKKKKFGEEGIFFGLSFLIGVHHLRKSGEQLNQGRNLEAGAVAEAFEGGCLLAGSFLLQICIRLGQSNTVNTGLL